uniref:Molybdenum cofactor synthesis protein cinnamon n=1 Tax=Lygus hesperus TaxID=30085 RepID=A0A0A9Z034_LYGHE
MSFMGDSIDSNSSTQSSSSEILNIDGIINNNVTLSHPVNCANEFGQVANVAQNSVYVLPSVNLSAPVNGAVTIDMPTMQYPCIQPSPLNGSVLLTSNGQLLSISSPSSAFITAGPTNFLPPDKYFAYNPVFVSPYPPPSSCIYVHNCAMQLCKQ